MELRIPPSDREAFVRVLDETLMALNGDYRTKRSRNIGMVGPRLVEVPPGTFYLWMRDSGKLGDQHKVPRVTNGRSVAEPLLAAAAANTGEHLPTADIVA